MTSDKGNKTVAMEANDYQNKMNIILQDLNTYRILRQDPTFRLQTKNNTLIDKLLKLKLITKRERNNMITTTALPPRIYGLPKIHKEGIPLRPICSSMDSPSYALCKHIIKILKQITDKSTYNVKNSLSFKEKINDTHIYDDEILISFDVVSLFSSIPTDLAIDIINRKLTEIKNHTVIPKQLFMDIIRFCVTENRYFKFEDKIFIYPVKRHAHGITCFPCYSRYRNGRFA